MLAYEIAVTEPNRAMQFKLESVMFVVLFGLSIHTAEIYATVGIELTTFERSQVQFLPWSGIFFTFPGMNI